MPRVGRDFSSEVVKLSPQPRSLTSSAKVYSTNQGRKLVRKGRKANSRAWQSALWDFYDIVPEFRAGCDWVGNALSKARLQVYYRGKPTTNQDALNALSSLFGGPEGQEEMLRLLGINFTVAGEAFVVGSPAAEVGEDDDWRVIASVEVNGSTSGERITVEGDELEDDELAIRLWKAHPRRIDEANSPSRAAMPILAEIVKLTQVIDAQADSRLTSAGILWVPSEMELPTITITAGEGDDEETTNLQLDGADGLYNQLVEIASVAIEKRDSAAAQVPIVIAAPGEFLEKIQHTEFWSGFDEHVKDLRDEAIRRLGTGMDMPPEVLTGTGEINHWGAWQIEEAAIKQYTEPLLQIIVSSLTKGYLRPVLRAWGVKDADGYSFFADTSAMRLRPNRSQEAIELWDRGALNTYRMLVENGFDPETDMMDEAERRVWLLLKVAGGSATPDQVAAALTKLGVEGMPSDTEGEVRESRPARSLEQHPDQSPPDRDESEALISSAALPVDGLVYATEQMVYRALERAGNRLKARVGRGAAEKITTDALDMYLSVPELRMDECEALLEDAWCRLDRFSYPGVSKHQLENALQSYTLTLLRMQRPHTRSALARHLLVELSES